MTTALRAELRKVRHTRSLLAVPAAALLVATAGTVLLLSVGTPQDIGDRLSTYGPLRFGPTNLGLLVVVFAVRTVTDESHHRTLAATFTRTPSRQIVLAAKAIVAATCTVALCAGVYLAVIAVTVVGVALGDLEMTWDIAATAALFGRVVVAMVLLSALGVAVGAAIGNRTVALVAVLVWFTLAEDLVGALLHVDRHLPSAAVRSLVSAGTAGATTAPVAASILVAFTFAASVAALASVRRDVP
jgi:ABC-type transport system involved in multi-copper enzyme maturation permease subunit